MTILEVETFVVKPEKQGEAMALWQKALKYMKENPKKTKAKSIKLFTQVLGGNFGSFVSMSEYDSIADWEKDYATMMQDETQMKLYQEFQTFIVPGTFSINILSSVE
jgi:NIPSNAP